MDIAWFACVPILALGAWGIVSNWVLWIRNMFLGGKDSLVPFVGALAGALGLWLAPVESMRSLWWVPLVVDIGTVLTILFLIVELVRRVCHKGGSGKTQ